MDTWIPLFVVGLLLWLLGYSWSFYVWYLSLFFHWRGAAASRPDSPIRPRLRQDDWRQGIASDKELMDRAIGKLVGTGGSAVSSTSGQLPTSAEIEGVGGLSCGALDPEF